jgi:peptidoglycan/xylan/chitin deacetylase (PgdA/CDA1 family)
MRRKITAPVLTYHHILRDEENTRFRHTSTTTSVRAFSNQMTWLRDQGYTTLTMYQLEGYVRNKMNLPARAVVITFDDGLKSVNRYAYPVLKQYGFRPPRLLSLRALSAIRRSGIRNRCSL